MGLERGFHVLPEHEALLEKRTYQDLRYTSHGAREQVFQRAGKSLVRHHFLHRVRHYPRICYLVESASITPHTLDTIRGEK